MWPYLPTPAARLAQWTQLQEASNFTQICSDTVRLRPFCGDRSQPVGPHHKPPTPRPVVRGSAATQLVGRLKGAHPTSALAQPRPVHLQQKQQDTGTDSNLAR